jgi:subtilisin family serine protease
MWRRLHACLLNVFIALVCVHLSANGQSPAAGNNPTGLQIVTLRRDADLDGMIKEFALKPRHRYRHALNGFAAPLDAATIQKLKQDKRVLAVEPDGRTVLCGQTYPAGITRMGLTNFPVAYSGTNHWLNVVVAVMDAGIQLDHPDLNVCNHVGFADIPEGSPGYDGDDGNGHGTHVAGIIGAIGAIDPSNGTEVLGVAPGVCLWSVQVIGTDGAGTWANFILGCDYIATNADQIEVVNASLGGTPNTASPYTAIHTAVSNLVSLGIVFVAAAGNSGDDLTSVDGYYGGPDNFVPAALPEVMAVSAMDPNPTDTNYPPAEDSGGDYDNIWNGSNYSLYPKPPVCTNPLINNVISPGAGMDVSAPGVNILSTYKGSSYAYLTGTSMASPHAAGLVALYIAANGRAHSLQDVINIRQTIVNYSEPQSQWTPDGMPFDPINNPTDDPDGNPEPLAYPSEAWVPVPNFTSENMTAQGFQLGFPTVPGYAYTVQSTASLNSSNSWATLASANGTGSLTTVTVTDPTPGMMQFYRLLRQPAP